jgi:very-short-patch-repair endonuclease
MPHNKPLTNSTDLKPLRRDLRSHGTPAEAYLWGYLKNRQVGGLRFRRQFSIDNYILDFYCPEAKVALELDGEVHNAQIEHDIARDKYLKERYGIIVVRYENRHAFERPRQIVEELLEVATANRVN